MVQHEITMPFQNDHHQHLTPEKYKDT